MKYTKLYQNTQELKTFIEKKLKQQIDYETLLHNIQSHLTPTEFRKYVDSDMIDIFELTPITTMLESIEEGTDFESSINSTNEIINGYPIQCNGKYHNWVIGLSDCMDETEQTEFLENLTKNWQQKYRSYNADQFFEFLKSLNPLVPHYEGLENDKYIQISEYMYQKIHEDNILQKDELEFYNQEKYFEIVPILNMLETIQAKDELILYSTENIKENSLINYLDSDLDVLKTKWKDAFFEFKCPNQTENASESEKLSENVSIPFSIKDNIIFDLENELGECLIDSLNQMDKQIHSISEGETIRFYYDTETFPHEFNEQYEMWIYDSFLVFFDKDDKTRCAFYFINKITDIVKIFQSQKDISDLIKATN